MEQEKRKVLIIDDELAMREYTAIEFTRAGFLPILVDNGKDAIDIATKELPEVIVLDLLMPGIHGFEILSALRKMPELSRSVIIVRSAKSYKSDIDKAIQMGANEYVIKPGNPGEIAALALKHLETEGHV